MEPTSKGPLPVRTGEGKVKLSSLAYKACPGKGFSYPEAYVELFGALPRNWLIGPYRRIFIGYSNVPTIRQRGASGGVITQTLIYLLDQGAINGAVVVQQGKPKPWLAKSVIARSTEDVREVSQSVYAPVPVNVILPEIASFPGPLAYVGLPDQVASLRQLQRAGHKGSQKVNLVIGPYVGTNLYFGAVESYLRSHGVHDLEEVTDLSYREGEWPGYLQIRTRSGRVLKAKKFYYNYLIPFYVTQSSLLAVDFTNELTDISVGDAWHPRYEAQGGGFSVVIARSERGENLLTEMEQSGLLELKEIELEEALSMHAHMFDFKKRGAFIRMQWRKAWGQRVPDYGYRPTSIPLSRKLVEVVILSIFSAGRTRFCRWLVEQIPLTVIGPLFEQLRQIWKNVSKPTKRQGLHSTSFEITRRST